MKNFEVVGHIKAFDDPEFCEAVNNLVEDSGETIELEDENGNKQIMRLAKPKPEVQQAINGFYLVRFYKAFVSREMIEKAHLIKGAVFSVKCAVLYNDRGFGYNWKEPVDLVLINEKSGECITLEYFKKVNSISSINDEKTKKYEIDKLTVDRRSVIEYKDDDKTIEAIVLDMNAFEYLIIDRDDFKDLVHDRKNYDEIFKKIIKKNTFVKTIGVLDESREDVLKNITEKCKYNNDV